VTTAELAEPTAIYVSRCKAWAISVAYGFFAVVADALVVVAVVSAVHSEDAIVIAFIFLITIPFLGLGTWYFGRRSLRALSHAVNPLPVLLIDDEGFECSYGRVRWIDVPRIEWQSIDEEPARVVFRLAPGTAWEPPAASYSSYLLRGRDDREVRVEMWARKKVMKQTLDRYYSGPSFI